MKIFIISFLFLLPTLLAFQPSRFTAGKSKAAAIRESKPLKFFDDMQLGTTEYAAIFALTIIPSLAFVKFVGDTADTSRSSMTENQKAKFQQAMMDVGVADFNSPTQEEEQLKRMIQKAYLEDKDVDVAVLEEKLRQRIAWRKEVIASKNADVGGVDEDGW